MITFIYVAPRSHSQGFEYEFLLRIINEININEFQDRYSYLNNELNGIIVFALSSRKI